MTRVVSFAAHARSCLAALGAGGVAVGPGPGGLRTLTAGVARGPCRMPLGRVGEGRAGLAALAGVGSDAARAVPVVLDGFGVAVPEPDADGWRRVLSGAAAGPGAVTLIDAPTAAGHRRGILVVDGADAGGRRTLRCRCVHLDGLGVLVSPVTAVLAIPGPLAPEDELGSGAVRVAVEDPFGAAEDYASLRAGPGRRGDGWVARVCAEAAVTAAALLARLEGPACEVAAADDGWGYVARVAAAGARRA